MLWQPFNTWLRIEFFNFKLLQNANSKLELYFPSFYKMENPLGYVVTDWFVVVGWKVPWAAKLLSAWLALLRFVVIVKKVPWDNLVGCHQSCLLALLPVQTTVHSIPLYRSSLRFFNEVRWCWKGAVLCITTTVICMISAGLDSLPAKRQNSPPLKDLRCPRLHGLRQE